MNTTTAAATAGVSIRTIQRWCQRGLIAAAKTAGRWIIDLASLRHHTRKGKPVEITAENLVAIGGREWTKGTMHRVYLNDWPELAGIGVSRYNSGNISSAAIDGEGVSNAEARRLLGAVEKVYWDAADGEIHIKWGYAEPRSLTRDDLKNRIISGIRTAIEEA